MIGLSSSIDKGRSGRGMPDEDVPGRHAPIALTALVVALFFIWGGATSLNDILIPKLKGLFQLSYAEAMLTQFAFFTAYAICSVPAGLLVGRFGYGRGIVLGLAVMAAGCLLFLPAASGAAYALFLLALFVLAAGITMLQVTANPLIAALGRPETAHSRLTLAQAFNSLGTTLWPLAGAHLILGSIATADPATLAPAELSAFQAREAAIIGSIYMVIAVVLLVIAALFWGQRRRLGGRAGTAVAGGLRRPGARLRFGVLAIFLYVGAEVTIGSLMVNYLMQPSVLGLDEQSAGQRIALYWGGAMIGRFIGAGLLRVVAAGKLLVGAALGAMALALLSAGMTGALAGWTLIAVGLMNSVMFPTIFSLALEGLGERTAQGSGLLCMAIVGGAIVPPLAGVLADATSLATALTVPAACYFSVAAFGWFARRPVIADEGSSA